MKNKAGEWVWILDTGKVIERDSEGKPLRAIGIHQDITARKQAEEQARLSQETNKSVFATMQEGIVIQDMNGAIMLCNQSAENILGLTYDQMIGRKSIDPRWHSIKADGSPFAGEDHPAMVTLRTREPQHNVIMGVHKPDGKLTWISINSQLLYQLDTHNPYAVYTVFHDITEQKIAENKLQDSQIKLQAILDSSTDSNILISPDMKVLSFNKTTQMYVEKLFGRSMQEGDDMWLFVTKDTEEDFWADFNRALKGEIVSLERELAFGEVKIWFAVNYFPVYSGNGEITGVSFNSTNIDQRKKAEVARIESEQRYRKVVETQTDFVLLSTADTTITFANKALCKALGVELEQIVGQQWINFALPEDIQGTLHKITQLSPDDSNFITENRDRRADGEIGWTQWVNQGVFDEQGKLVQIQSVGRDITEIRQAEITLKENDRFLSNLIENLPGYVYRANNDANFTPIYLSPQVQEVTGYSVSEYLIGKVNSCGHEIHTEDKSMVVAAVQKAIRTGQAYMCEYRITTKSGQEKWLWKRGRGVFDDKGELLYLEGFVMDITENKENELQRTILFRRLKNIAKHLPGFIYQYSLRPDGTSFFDYASDGIERLFGQKAATFANDASEAFATVHPDDLAKLQESIMLSAQNLTEWHHEWRSVVEGRTIWLQGTASPQFQKNGNIMWYGYINDISEHKKMETELFRLALVAKRTSNLVVIADAQRNIVWVNDAFVNLTGYSLKEVYGQNPGTFLQFEETNPETVQFIRQKLQANEYVRCEILNKGKDGTKYWLDVEIQPLFDEKRNLTGFIAIEADITQRKIADEKIRKQNEILREITFTQAHTLRRPVANILGLVQLLELDKDKGMDTISKYLDYIAASAKETDEVIRQIIDKTSEID